MWRCGLWFNVWEMDIRSKMWRVAKSCYHKNSSCILWMKMPLIFHLIQVLSRVLLFSYIVFFNYILLLHRKNCEQLGVSFG